MLLIGGGSAGNSLVISNGGTFVASATIGSGIQSSNNSVIVTGTNSLWSNKDTIWIGSAGSGNSLVISDGGSLLEATNASIGYGITASNNSALVTGSNSLWSNRGSLYVGDKGASCGLVISDGGVVSGSNGYIGYTTNSSNNLGLVTGANSLWSNTGTFYVGYSGGGTLTVANRGNVVATNITIASSNTATGTLNIGNLTGSDGAGSIVAPTITFGAGSGAINFNQVDTATLTSSITGIGSVNQLGSGTTIITGRNSYSGTTMISNGVLQVGIGGTSGSLGSSSILNNGALVFNLSSSYTLSNSISGKGSLRQIGNGTIILIASNNYSGGTIISAGSLSFTRPSAFGSGVVPLSEGTSLVYGGTGPVTLTNGIIVDSGAGIIANTSGSLLTLGGTLTKSGSIINFNGGSYDVSGKITGSADHSDLVLSNASVKLSNIGNDYNGPTKLLAGSSLTAGVVNALPKTSILTLGGVGESSSITNSFDLNGNSQTIGGLYSLGGGNEQILNTSGTAATLTLGGNSSFGGSIKGNLNLSLTNAAITLSGNNSYTGSTTLNGTSLNLTNSGSLSGTTNLIIGSGSVLSLGGNNQVNTNAALNLNGGSLSLGAAATASRAKAQTFTNLTLTANSVIDFGNLSGTSALTFNSVALGSYNLTVLDWSGTNQWGSMSLGDPTHLSVTTGLLDSGSLSQISFYGTAGEFLGIGAFSGNEIVPVPEPNVMIIAGLLFLGLLAYRFRLWV